MPPPPRKIASKIIGGPARYRAGKPAVPEATSSSEDDEEDEEQKTRPAPRAKPPPPRPSASSFPKHVQRPAVPAINEDDFETEESDDESGNNGSDSSGEEGSDTDDEDEDSEAEEDSSSDDDTAKRKLIRPIFVKKGQRAEHVTVAAIPEKDEGEIYAEQELRRRERANEVVQEQLERRAAERAAGKKEWDESEADEGEDVDDRDGLDPEAEETAWKLREIKRVKRDREALILAEKQREEVERRRNLTAEERDAEDKEFLDAQKEERDGKGKLGYLNKYYHKGAFYQDDAKAAGLAQRDLIGATFQDQVDRSVLPEYLQIRDMTKIGKKGRTRYKDLKSQDTGRWGDFDDRRRGREGDYADTQDERFMPDRERDRMADRTGANASALGDRKRFGDSNGGDYKRVKAQ